MSDDKCPRCNGGNIDGDGFDATIGHYLCRDCKHAWNEVEDLTRQLAAAQAERDEWKERADSLFAKLDSAIAVNDMKADDAAELATIKADNARLQAVITAITAELPGKVADVLIAMAFGSMTHTRVMGTVEAAIADVLNEQANVPH